MDQQDQKAALGNVKGEAFVSFLTTAGAQSLMLRKSLGFSLPELEYLMISYTPYYLPREFSSIFFVAVYLPPQSDVGTKTTLDELYNAISKQENAHPEASLLGAGDFNAGKLNSVLTRFYQHFTIVTRAVKTLAQL